MNQTKDYLFELGCEELPPKSLANLGTSFRNLMKQYLEDKNLSFKEIEWHATPRRLAIIIRNLAVAQPTRAYERKGPAIKAAFDEQGQPTKAALGFAKSCGTDVESLITIKAGNNSWLGFNGVEEGLATSELLPSMIEKALHDLPIAKRMRWGKQTVSFIRPVHWIVSLWGEQHLPLELYGIQSDIVTYGHRVHAPEPYSLVSADSYCDYLQNSGKVVTLFERRKDLILKQIESNSESINANPIIEEALLDEVTALVEWPIALLGKFDEAFLRIPQEALISSMQEHQKYFPLVDKSGNLKPYFITISNVESKDPAQVLSGNERVIRPRLADAQFFYDQDQKQPLSTFNEKLKSIVFQQKLGTLYDKSERLAHLSSQLAEILGYSPDNAAHAGILSKADLATLMVGEFPELQGTMGKYYLLADTSTDNISNKEAVAAALEEQYLPRFSGDRLPLTEEGIVLSLADKMDTLVAIFGINQSPSGDKDPFGLRRACLGILRIAIENRLNIDLKQLIKLSKESFKKGILENPNIEEDVLEFIFSRYRTFYQSQSISTDIIQSVEARKPSRPFDFDSRIKAVKDFKAKAEAFSLAEANKRVSNILKKSDMELSSEVNTALFEAEEERSLYDKIVQAEEKIPSLIEKQEYQNALSHLATLKETIDLFFDKVMVNADELSLRINRLSLIKRLRDLFLPIADISLLKIE